MQTGQSHTDYMELYEEQLTKTAALTHELTQIKKMIFGSRRERFIPAPEATKKDLQLALDLDAETIAQCRITSATKVEYIRTQVEVIPNKPKSHPGRMKLPDHLRGETILLQA